MTHLDVLIRTAISKLPKATHESPKIIDVLIPEDQKPVRIDENLETSRTVVSMVSFRKVIKEHRELDNDFLIERGFDYILIKR